MRQFIVSAVLLAAAIGARPAMALELYLKTGPAYGEAAYLTGLHKTTQHFEDAYYVADIGLRGKPVNGLRMKYDYQSKSFDRYSETNWDTHKLKAYWQMPSLSGEIYAAISHYERNNSAYLVTQYFKPRLIKNLRGGALKGGVVKFGPTWRDKDFHIYDAFDSTALGAEMTFSRRGHYIKASVLEQDATGTLYDRRTGKVSWQFPMGESGPHRFKGRVELRQHDYFAVTENDKTSRETRVKWRAEWTRALNTGWSVRARAQYTWRDSNLAETSFDDSYGEVMLIYRGTARIDDENENN